MKTKRWTKRRLLVFGLVALVGLLGLAGGLTRDYWSGLIAADWDKRGVRGDAVGGHMSIVNAVLSLVTLVALWWSIQDERRHHREQMGNATELRRDEELEALWSEFWQIQQATDCLMIRNDSLTGLEWTRTHLTVHSTVAANSCEFAAVFRVPVGWTFETQTTQAGEPNQFFTRGRAYVWVLWKGVHDQWTTRVRSNPEWVAIAVSPLLLGRIGSLIDRVVVYLTEEVGSTNEWKRIQRCLFLLQRLVHVGFEEVFEMYVSARAMDFCQKMDEQGLIDDPANLDPLNSKVVMALELSPLNGYLRFSENRNSHGDYVAVVRTLRDSAFRSSQPRTNPPVIQ